MQNKTMQKVRQCVLIVSIGLAIAGCEKLPG